jgi:hypothetical protein
MTREEELLERIQELEEMNSILHDKLDMIYSIVAPEEGDAEDSDDDEPEAPQGGLVQIDMIKPKAQQKPTNQSPKRV